MNTFDYICLVIVGLLGFRGMYIGFLQEFSKKGGVVVGILTAVMFTGTLTDMLSETILRWHLGIWGSVIIAIVLVIAGYFAVIGLLSIFKNFVAIARLEFLNHLILGFALGVIEGLVIVLFLWVILRYQRIIPIPSIFAESWTIDKLSPVLLWMLKIDFKSYISDFKGVL